MTDVFLQVIEQNFAVMGDDATYLPKGASEPLPPIKVMPRRPDEMNEFLGGSIVSSVNIFDVMSQDVPEPQEGDKITFKDVVYVVQSKPKAIDGNRYVWAMECYPE